MTERQMVNMISEQHNEVGMHGGRHSLETRLANCGEFTMSNTQGPTCKNVAVFFYTF